MHSSSLQKPQIERWIPLIKYFLSTLLRFIVFQILKNINKIKHFVTNHLMEFALFISCSELLKDSFKNKSVKLIFVNEINSCEMTCFLHQIRHFSSCSVEAKDHSYGISWGQLSERNLLAILVLDMNDFLYMFQLVEVYGRSHQLTLLFIFLLIVCLFLSLISFLLFSLFIFFFLRSLLFGLCFSLIFFFCDNFSLDLSL